MEMEGKCKTNRGQTPVAHEPQKGLPRAQRTERFLPLGEAGRASWRKTR